MFKTQDRETGTFIDTFATYEDAAAALSQYEADDKAEGIYIENFYEIAPQDFDAAVALMDDDIREELHRELAPCTDLDFLREYCRRHYEKYGEIFSI